METLFLKVLNMSLAASGLILAVMALRLLLRRAPRRLTCLLWALAALRLLCPVSLTNPWSLALSAQTIPADIAQVQPPQIHSGVSAINGAVNPALAQAELENLEAPWAVQAQPRQSGGGWLSFLAWFWLAAAGLLAGYGGFSAWRLRQKMGGACREKGNIYRTEQADSPFVLGLIRPRIYLPAELQPQAAYYVIAHEQSHIRRGDHWAKALGWLLVSLHWFNPLVWAAYLLMCRDLELACDERVIRRMSREQIADYAQTLLECSLPKAAPGPLAFGRLGVKGRIKHILSYQKPSFWLAPATILACGLAAFFWMTDPGEGPPLPAEPNVFSISIQQQQEDSLRQIQDREQIQETIAALAQARPAGQKQLNEGGFTLWLDDGGAETQRWRLDDQGLLQGPDQSVYRLGEKQVQAVEAAWRQGKEEGAYTLTLMEYGKARQETVLTGDQADIARQCIWSSRVISAPLPGQPPEQLPLCWRIQSGQSEYYVYLAEGQPVLQSGRNQQWQYTRISDPLYEKLTGQTAPADGEQKESQPLQLLAPVQGEISAGFGSRIHPITGKQTFHPGLDFAGETGSPVTASADGQVIQSGWDETYGFYLLIDHGNGTQTFYGNNSELLAEQGQQTSQGQQIAKLGGTGRSTGPHCHWEIRVNGQPVNPTDYLAYSEESEGERPAD